MPSATAEGVRLCVTVIFVPVTCVVPIELIYHFLLALGFHVIFNAHNVSAECECTSGSEGVHVFYESVHKYLVVGGGPAYRAAGVPTAVKNQLATVLGLYTEKIIGYLSRIPAGNAHLEPVIDLILAATAVVHGQQHAVFKGEVSLELLERLYKGAVGFKGNEDRSVGSRYAGEQTWSMREVNGLKIGLVGYTYETTGAGAS